MRRKLIRLLLTVAVPLTALCPTPPVYAAGTLGFVYYLQSGGGVGSAPFPFDPRGGSVPVVQISPGVYLVEDGSQATAAATQMADAEVPPLPGSGDGTTNSSPVEDASGQPINYTGLWIQCTNQGGGDLGLNLHNT